MTVDPKVFINTFLSVREGVRAGTITDPVVLTLFAMVEEANEVVCWGVGCVHEARMMERLASNSKDMMSSKEMRLVWDALLHHAAVIKEDDGTRAELLAWLHKRLSGEEGLHGSESVQVRGEEAVSRANRRRRYRMRRSTDYRNTVELMAIMSIAQMKLDEAVSRLRDLRRTLDEMTLRSKLKEIGDSVLRIELKSMALESERNNHED